MTSRYHGINTPHQTKLILTVMLNRLNSCKCCVFFTRACTRDAGCKAVVVSLVDGQLITTH